MNFSYINRYLAELLGTCVLVLLGCGSAIFAGDQIGLVGISFSFGLALLIMIYSIGPVSGCHLNPAVTLCLALTKKFPLKDVIGYIVCQCLGAILGGCLLYFIATGKINYDIGKGFALNGFAEHSPQGYNMLACFITEVMMTALLLYVILATTNSFFHNNFAGLVIGLTLTVIHLVSIPITNTSVNFARSLGVSVIHSGWALEQLWLFAVAHIIAIGLAIALYNVTCKSN